MKTLGINYKVNKHGPPKSGTLPQIDVEQEEILLRELEPKVIVTPDNESVKNIMDLYQKVIIFYIRLWSFIRLLTMKSMKIQ